MDWMLKYRRYPEWRRGCRERALASTFETPFPLLLFFLLTVLLLHASCHSDYKARRKQIALNFQLSVIFLFSVFLILFVHLTTTIQEPPCTACDCWHRRSDTSPWAATAAVLLLLVLVSYQSSLQSKWFKL